MGATLVLVPAVIASWPALMAAAASVAASAGFEPVKKVARAARKQRSLEIDMENMDLVTDDLKHGDSIVLQRESVTVTISRNERGQCRACVHGDLAESELENIGRDLMGQVIQKYVHMRLETELEAQGFVTVEEETEADRTIRLRVRRFEE